MLQQLQIALKSAFLIFKNCLIFVSESNKCNAGKTNQWKLSFTKVKWINIRINVTQTLILLKYLNNNVIWFYTSYINPLLLVILHSSE